MKNKKILIFAICIAYMFAFTNIAAFAKTSTPQTESEQDVSLHFDVEYGAFVYDTAYHKILRYTGNSEIVVIPSEIDGDIITEIGLRAFAENTSIKNIIISDGITTIDDEVFSNCTSLETVEFPDSLTSIGDGAFFNCTSLSKVTMSKNLEEIGYSAFNECSSLDNLTLPDSVRSIGRFAFGNTKYYDNEYNWNNDVLYIGNHLIKAKPEIAGGYSIKAGTLTVADYAFESCNDLEVLNFAGSVKVIGERACTIGSLERIAIPDSVELIKAHAFDYCKYYTEESNWIGDGLYIDNHLVGVKNDVSGEFVIKDGTRSIIEGAFSPPTMTSSLESVIIPGSVKNIPYAAFSYCTSLKNVTIWEGVESIGYSAFSNCKALESIALPNSMTGIGDSAFYNCTSLKSIKIPENVIFIGSNAFQSCFGGLTVYGYSGTYAEEYANDNGINFFDLNRPVLNFDDIKMEKPVINYDENKVTVNVNISKNESMNNAEFKVYVIGYDQNGGIVGMKSIAVNGSELRGDIEFNADEKPSCVKVLAISDKNSVSPLCKAGTAE